MWCIDSVKLENHAQTIQFTPGTRCFEFVVIFCDDLLSIILVYESILIIPGIIQS